MLSYQKLTKDEIHPLRPKHTRRIRLPGAAWTRRSGRAGGPNEGWTCWSVSARPAAGPEPGHRLPLCTVSLALSHVTISPHSVFHYRVIVLHIDVLFFSPNLSWKTNSLCLKPDFFLAPPAVLETDALAGAPHSRTKHAHPGPLSFLVTFQVRKLDVPLMLGSQLCLRPLFPHVYMVFPAPSGWRQRNQP